MDNCDIECKNEIEHVKNTKLPCEWINYMTSSFYNPSGDWEDLNKLNHARNSLIYIVKSKGKEAFVCNENIPPQTDPKNYPNT